MYDNRVHSVPDRIVRGKAAALVEFGAKRIAIERAFALVRQKYGLAETIDFFRNNLDTNKIEIYNI